MIFNVNRPGNETTATECRCPTCRKVQPWSDECRRCGTDLSLLRRLTEESARLQRVLLAAMTARDDSLAELTLQRLMQIAPTPQLDQLLRFVAHEKERHHPPPYYHDA